MVTFVCLIRGAVDRAKFCRSTFQGAGRETWLHVGEKEEKDGRVHL